jgi:hypothetical protein
MFKPLTAFIAILLVFNSVCAPSDLKQSKNESRIKSQYVWELVRMFEFADYFDMENDSYDLEQYLIFGYYPSLNIAVSITEPEVFEQDTLHFWFG